jgi:hypothetical protein
MFFLNLSMTEFLTLLGGLSAVVTALYLLDRAKRKKLVSTLQFWTAATHSEEEQSRRRVREPWSLVLQLLALLFLLLGVAQLEWGTREHLGRDHVLILDTSAWMSARVGSPPAPLMAEAKRKAEAWLHSLPARDRVLLVAAGGLITPVTAFTPDRSELTARIRASQAGYTALSLPDALSFAAQAQSWSGRRAGDIVYIGAGRTRSEEAAGPAPPNLRVISLSALRDSVAASQFRGEDCGIRRMGVRRAEQAPDEWEVSVAVRNFGSRPREVSLVLEYAGLRFSPRLVTLAPGEEKSIPYAFSTHTAGTLNASLEPGDELSADDHASVALPKLSSLRIAVYTARPEVWRPLMEASRLVAAQFHAPAEYKPNPEADLIVIDGFAPPRRPTEPSLWVKPPASGSPVPVTGTGRKLTVSRWLSESALGSGLHAKAVDVEDAETFELQPGDVTVASSAQGPAVVAREASQSTPRLAVIGFDPLAGQLRFALTTPLLFANLTRWLAPEDFRTLEYIAGAVGSVTVPLDSSEDPAFVRVTDDRGFTVPHAVRNQHVEFYVERPGTVNVASFGRKRVYSLTLPDVAEFVWKAPQRVAQGIPAPTIVPGSAVDLWQWLALAAAACLLLEWYLFGRRTRTLRRASVAQSGSRAARAEDRPEVLVK